MFIVNYIIKLGYKQFYKRNKKINYFRSKSVL